VTEFRIALRQCVRQFGFALTVVCTLGVTIGATTAVFSVVNTVLIRALPFAAPERLVWIASVRPDNPRAPFSLPEFMDYRSQSRTLAGVAAYANWNVSLAEDGIAEKLTGARMSANAFDVLGVSAAAGRLLNDSDDRADAPLVVVLSHRLWERQFGGNADVVGKTARINGESYLIVGVLPRQFPIPLLDIDAVAALTPDRDPLRHVRNSVNFLRVFGRLNPGMSANQAQAELTAICRSLRQQFPVEYARKEAVNVTALREALVGDFRQSMLLLFGAVVTESSGRCRLRSLYKPTLRLCLPVPMILLPGWPARQPAGFLLCLSGSVSAWKINLALLWLKLRSIGGQWRCIH